MTYYTDETVPASALLMEGGEVVPPSCFDCAGKMVERGDRFTCPTCGKTLRVVPT